MDSALDSLKWSFQNFIKSQDMLEVQQNRDFSNRFADKLEDALRKIRSEVHAIQQYLLTQKLKQDKVIKTVISSIETLKKAHFQTQNSNHVQYSTVDPGVLSQMKRCIETQKNISQNIVTLLKQNQQTSDIDKLKEAMQNLDIRLRALEQGTTAKAKVFPNDRSLKNDVAKTRERLAQIERRNSEKLNTPKPPLEPPSI